MTHWWHAVPTRVPADTISRSWGRAYVGTEHLLMGLARADGMAAEAQAEFALTAESSAGKVIRSERTPVIWADAKLQRQQ